MTGKRRAVVAGATTLVLLGSGIGVAQAAPAPGAISLVAATKSVIAERYVGDEGSGIYLDLGVNVIAGKSPLEIRTTRTSYQSKIVARQIVTKNGKKTAVKLPAGSVSDFSGLRNFTTITIKNSAGKVVKKYQTDFCPNTYDSVRTRRDAPAQTPYPRYCAGRTSEGGNPFLLGSVWGIQAGWNAGINPMPTNGKAFDLAAGKYQVSVALNPAYRKFFKVPVKSATASVAVTVVNVTPEQKAASAAAVAPKTTPGGHNHGEGDESAQISDYLPQFRAPASRPTAAKVAPKTGPRPDLRSLPAWGISLEKGRNETTGQVNGRWYVNFGATVWNAGSSPLLVDGFRRTGSELMDAYQYVFDAKGKQVGSFAAGTMEWDKREGHKHWHFTDFARYDLLKADKKLAVRSGKEAFCLANTDAVDYTLKSAKWRPENTDLSTACGGNTAVAVREVLDIGNGDTYSQDRPGQSFDVTGLANGTYYIRVKANPVGKLSELSTKNNISYRKIVLGGTKTARTLSVPAVYGIRG
ncbi:lysyl oxidase family protein [Actinoplanes awajinensis]|uniref:Protein-lysine 6-oxidase n=1 Tax=Actinoplanes awajinensis subsp. mycoplanecinus TaxID=135947 RepID=A0A101JMA5_9ACTN|nr:lysyl oxidase family protein [Actinoplanes awajinensis]KUL29253.1 hypothetical protein ADL15_29295 [Actinoplanes awajinensis subsp. mycoplanecinus]